jgi:hypothetical protein
MLKCEYAFDSFVSWLKWNPPNDKSYWGKNIVKGAT